MKNTFNGKLHLDHRVRVLEHHPFHVRFGGDQQIRAMAACDAVDADLVVLPRAGLLQKLLNRRTIRVRTVTPKSSSLPMSPFRSRGFRAVVKSWQMA
jgi:hypothetical protein